MTRKTCNKCDSEKSIAEFYKNKNMKDGHANECKSCVKARAVEWNKNNKDKKREAGRKWARENAERSRELKRRYYENNKGAIDKRYSEWASANKDKVREYSRKWAENNKDKIQDYYLNNKEYLDKCRKDWAEQNRESVNKSNAEWKSRNPKKVNAHNMVNNSLRDGKIVKPLSCECCSVFTETLHAHHSDYNKPLDVEWLCVPCHSEWHKNNDPII